MSATDWPEPDFSRGLIPTIVQEASTGQVRMLGYMNEDAYRITRDTGLLTFWSRSRERLWPKGESSGNVHLVRDVLLDCDGDTLLVLVEATGPTCHTGTDSCFGDASQRFSTEPRTHDGRDALANAELRGAGGESELRFLVELERMIAERDRNRPDGSYTARLLAGGAPVVGRKVAEEALEAALAASLETPSRLVDEAADLVYHLLVLLRSRGVALTDVVCRLSDRQGAGDLSADDDADLGDETNHHGRSRHSAP